MGPHSSDQVRIRANEVKIETRRKKLYRPRIFLLINQLVDLSEDSLTSSKLPTFEKSSLQARDGQSSENRFQYPKYQERSDQGEYDEKDFCHTPQYSGNFGESHSRCVVWVEIVGSRASLFKEESSLNPLSTESLKVRR